MTRPLRHFRFVGVDAAIGIGFGLVALVVYLTTLSPTVGFMDSGELAAAQYRLGVAHPTGYPLFTLLGRAFLLLPFEGRVIWKLNLMTALLAASAVVALYRAILYALTGERVSPTLRARLAAGAASLSVAFSGVFWPEAVLLEVYALHLLLLSLTTWLFLRALANPREERLWLLFAFLLGLAFTNHLMTALLAPAFLYLHFATFRFGREAWKRIAIAAPPFLLGLTPYLYLPIRAAAHPVVNWGDPATLDAFWRHVTGAQFRFFMFHSREMTLDKLAAFLPDLARNLGYAPLLVAALGIVAMARANPRLSIFTALLFASGVAYTVNYGFDDAAFALNVYPPTAIWMAFGIAVGIPLLAKRRRLDRGIAALCAATFLFPLALNRSDADRSRDFAYEDFARNVLESMDSGAIVLTQAYGNLTAPALYLQTVEGVRPDVVVLQASMLILPWYPSHLNARDPSIVAASRGEFEALGGAIRNKVPDGLLVNLYGRVALESIILNHRATRAVHATQDLGPEGFGGVPWGILFRFFPDSVSPPPFDDPEPRFRPIRRFDERNFFIRTNYSALFANLAERSLFERDTISALERYRKAAALDPERDALVARLRQLETAYGARTH